MERSGVHKTFLELQNKTELQRSAKQLKQTETWFKTENNQNKRTNKRRNETCILQTTCMETCHHQLQDKTTEDSMRSDVSPDRERRRWNNWFLWCSSCDWLKETTTTSYSRVTWWFQVVLLLSVTVGYFIEPLFNLYFYCFCLNHFYGWFIYWTDSSHHYFLVIPHKPHHLNISASVSFMSFLLFYL